MESFIEVYRKYAQFSGRARRREYWMWVLIYVLTLFLLIAVEKVLGIESILYFAFTALSFIPALAVGVRRLHDTGRSGWWMLLLLIPLVGSLVLLVLFVLDSQPGSNQFGPNPKLAQADEGDSSAASIS
ncbi:DUF805 domain-containing protein [Allohahella marinimesophila]|uniref:DUF805 domain-containing protein n=1 Tax=Allohahella marinimesophila TaxID=1054972 RepID=A0ABP7NJQ5_9GAMM